MKAFITFISSCCFFSTQHPFLVLLIRQFHGIDNHHHDKLHERDLRVSLLFAFHILHVRPCGHLGLRGHRRVYPIRDMPRFSSFRGSGWLAIVNGNERPLVEDDNIGEVCRQPTLYAKLVYKHEMWFSLGLGHCGHIIVRWRFDFTTIRGKK